jgi:hypothetical protein
VLESANLSSIVLDYRLHRPEYVYELAMQRHRRAHWESAEGLVILAVDHPARRVVSASGQEWAMANRADLLRRSIRVLMQPGMDGLLGTPDLIEELLVLNDWVSSQGGPDFLAKKVLVGSMNRGGLAQTVFELDDFVSAYTPERIEKMGLDAGKLLLRMDPNSPDSAQTLRYCFEAIERLSVRDLPVFLEPLAVPQTTDDLVRLVGVASALGSTSVGRWLKLPMAADFERIARATTCPILLLGGQTPGNTEGLLSSIRRCLEAGDNVRGMMIGRGVLYPQHGMDAAECAARVVACVHNRAVEEVQTWANL